MMTKTIGQTAAITNYMIERVRRDRVDLLESQGDAWITVYRGIDRGKANAMGFNLDSPVVQRVFDGVED